MTRQEEIRQTADAAKALIGMRRERGLSLRDALTAVAGDLAARTGRGSAAGAAALLAVAEIMGEAECPQP